MPASGAVDITVKKIGKITRVKMNFLTDALGVATGTYTGRLAGKLLSYRSALGTAASYTLAIVDETGGAPIHTAVSITGSGAVAIPQLGNSLIVAIMTNTITVNVSSGGNAKTAVLYLYIEDNSDG